MSENCQDKSQWIPHNVKDIMQKLIDNGHEAYIIGGAVRDYFLGLEPKDYDIFTNCEDLKKVFPEANIIGNDERQNKIFTVIVDGIEISRYRNNGERTEFGTTLQKHLDTCDLTINAMCCDIKGNIQNVPDDIMNQNIRFVGSPEQRIAEDPLRILRAIRFVGKTNYTMTEETDIAIRLWKDKLLELPIERIKEEFIKILHYPKSFELLKETKILDMFLPELSALRGLEGGHYHLEDCFTHSRLAYTNSLTLTNNILISLACLLHDIGKASCYEKVEDKISFNNHQNIGCDMVKEIMTRMKFSDKETKFVSTMIKHHMMGSVNELNNRTIIKIVNELEDAGITVEDMLIMTYSDNQANLKNTKIKFNEFYQGNNWLRTVYKLKYERLSFRKKDLEITGHDIINLGITQGVEIGRLIQTLYDEVIEAKIKNDRPLLLYRLKELI